MVKIISQAETLPLRSMVLRKGMPLEQCVLPTDNVNGIFHLGLFREETIISIPLTDSNEYGYDNFITAKKQIYSNENLICIGTFFPEDYPDHGEGGFRLRGMATDPLFAGQGYGAQLIKFAISKLSSAHASYLWCNARSTAAGFYRKLGFEIISEEFEVPGIGPHFNMLYSLNENKR